MDVKCSRAGGRTQPPHADGPETEVAAVKGAFHFVVVDLQAGKDTQRILADLNKCVDGGEGGGGGPGYGSWESCAEVKASQIPGPEAR